MSAVSTPPCEGRVSPLKQSMRRVLLEVHAPGLKPQESVRVSGNTAELGEWNVHRSKPLTKREGAADIWYTELLLAERTAEYRYLVVEILRAGEKVGLRVTRRETFIDPRRLSVSNSGSPTEGDLHHMATDTDGLPVLRKDDGIFAYNEDGVYAEDEGWLVSTSELELQLQYSDVLHPVRIDTLPEDTLFSIKVGSIKYCSKAEDVCKVSECLPIQVKVLDRDEGGCEFKAQGEYGHTFKHNQMLVFWTQAHDFTYLAFAVDIYSVGEGRGAEFVGRTSILPQHLKENAGKLILTVLSPQFLPVGTITFSYIVINPIPYSPRIYRMRHSYANYWKKHKRCLDIGHRGLGDSFRPPEDLKPSATENTIASLKRAGAHGADYVEFDVQLTKDLVPVVYHDFTVCTTLARRTLLSGELYKVFVKDLTLRQLHYLKLDHSSVLDGLVLSSADTTPYASDAEGSYVSSDEASGTSWPPRGKDDDDGPERRTFPTLEKVFRSLPPHIGFNIEVKYPVPHKEGDTFSFPYFERNMMADIILTLVYRLARKRKIIFSCFDPDMCTVLRRKQPKYPVLFLSTAKSPKYPTPHDIRARSFHDAMMHARAEKLLGIDVCSTAVLRQPELIQDAVSKQLVLFTWGEENNDYGNLIQQKKLGVHAVIYDRITNLIPPQKNVFADEVDGEEEEGEGEGEGEEHGKLPDVKVEHL